MTTELEQQIPDLITKLGNENILIRQRARLMLVHSIPSLLEALKSENSHRRWEATRALGDLSDPRVAPALCDQLLDVDFSVRWAAMEGLVNQGHNVALRPMLESFVKHFDSAWLREGVHHVLRVFKDRNQLSDLEIELFNALDKQQIPGFEPSWNGQAAWAAEKVLEVLN